MFLKFHRQVVVLMLMASFISGCAGARNAARIPETTPASQPAAILPGAASAQETPSFDAAEYAFRQPADPTQRYLFYLHGKIIENKGIPAISPDFGEYQYQAILEKLSSYGFLVISELRGQNSDSMTYAQRVSEQVNILLDSGVPAGHITVVGASKGAGIAIFASHLLKNESLNFVLLSICSPDTVDELKNNGISLYGNVLSIYDSVDDLAGSCQELFAFSAGKGIARHNEIVLEIGSGHGILFQPLDEWIQPTIEWAGKP